ncbi:ATP-binding protein [Deinococcus radiopugnans]|uniref:ATP-binding protein n=1 Tax=Deinococcus radiopugnans TaxID=57497 RepID=UPI003623DA14
MGRGARGRCSCATTGGLNPQDQDRLFRVFQRPQLEREFEGTGVGLAKVRRIVARQGDGQRRQRAGRGSAVRLYAAALKAGASASTGAKMKLHAGSRRGPNHSRLGQQRSTFKDQT